MVTAEQQSAADDDALIPTLEEAVRALREGLGERRSALVAERPMPEVMTPSFAAYRAYAEAMRLRYQEGDYHGSARLAREALARDPDFASAWYLLSLNLREPLVGQADSGWLALEQAMRRPSRLTRAERLVLEGADARRRWHLSQALQAYEQLVQERPNDPNAWNRLGIVLYYFRGPEAMLEALDRAATVMPFPMAQFNRTVILIAMGRRVEARRVAQEVPNDAERIGFMLSIAALDANWAELDSLIPVYERETGRAAWRWRAVQNLVRGELRQARTAFERDGGLTLLCKLVIGTPITPRNTTSWVGAFETALAGDTAEARASLIELTRDTLDYRVQPGGWSAAVEAAIAAQAGDWAAVVRHSQPLRRDRLFINATIGNGVRWLTATALERLGDTDSAAIVLGELVEPRRLDGFGYALQLAAANSFLRQRLIVLLSQAGRVEDAQHNYKIFTETFTNPDPEYEWMLTEARDELEKLGRGR